MKKHLSSMRLAIRVAALLTCFGGPGCNDVSPRTEPPPRVPPDSTTPSTGGAFIPPGTDSLSSRREAPAAITVLGEDSVSLGLPTLRLVREYGCEACDGPELLDLVRGVTAGSDRLIAVLNRSAPYIRVWNVDSNSAAGFGMEGDGPGELRRPFGVGFIYDSVVVFDNRGSGSRIERYGPTGNHLGYALPPLPFQLGPRHVFSASPSGRWAIWVNEPFGQDLRILRVNLASGAASAIAIPPQLLTGVPDSPAPTGLSAAVSDEGTVALGDGGEYILALISPEGSTVFGGREIPRRIRSEEEVDTLFAQFDRVFAGVLGRRAPPQFDRERFKEIPHFGGDDLRFDGRNRLWVKTLRAPASTMFDIFDQNLAFLGTLQVEGEVTVYHIGSTLLVGASENSSRVPIVRVWSVVEP